MKSTQRQESDVANEGGTAPGGTVAFMGAASQWSTSNAAVRNNFPTAQPNASPIKAAKMQHYGLADEAPDGSGNVPIHPGVQPGKFRTASDANPRAPGGMDNDPTANDGRPISPDGRHRGDSPEVPKQTRGPYRS